MGGYTNIFQSSRYNMSKRIPYTDRFVRPKTLDWLLDRKGSFTSRITDARADLVCDGCKEKIPKGNKTIKIGRWIRCDLDKRMFQIHATLCPDCAQDFDAMEYSENPREITFQPPSKEDLERLEHPEPLEGELIVRHYLHGILKRTDG